MYDIVLKNQSGEKTVYKSVSELNVPCEGGGTAPFAARHLARVDVNNALVSVTASETCAYGVDYVVSANCFTISGTTSLEEARVAVSIGGESLSSTKIVWDASDDYSSQEVKVKQDDAFMLAITVPGGMIIGDLVIAISV